METEIPEGNDIDSLSCLAKSASVFFVAMVFSRIIGYLFQVLVAKTDVELFGVYSLTMVLIQVTMIFCLFGMAQGIERYLPYYLGRGEREKADIAFSTAIKISMLSSIIFVMLLLYSLDFLSELLNAEKLPLLLKYFAFLIPVLSASTIFYALLITKLKVAKAVLTKELFERLIRVFTVFLLLFFGLRYMALGIGFAISTILSLFFLIYFSRGLFRFRYSGFDWEMVAYSLPLLLANVMIASAFYVDSLMLSYLTDVFEVAYYSVGTSTAMMIFLVPTSFLAVFLPIVTKKYAMGESIINEYESVTRWAFIFSLPILAFMLFFGTEFILFVFGPNYAISGTVLSIIIIFYFIFGLSYPAKQILLMHKRTKLVLALTSTSFLVNVALNILLIPLAKEYLGFGMIGAGLATGFSMLFLSFMYFHHCLKYLKITLINKGYLMPILSIAVSVLLSQAINGCSLFTANIKIVLVAFALFFSYASLLFFTGALNRQDIEVLKAVKSDVFSFRL